MARSKKRPSRAPDGNDISPPTSKQRANNVDDDDAENDENNDAVIDERAHDSSDDDADADTDSRSTGGIPLRQVNTPGRPAEAGVIQQVHVENFMCHKKLTVKLCQNVNFIHGQNGSGKSAVLAAIQICLGAGAKRTHRARNLKELIRKDAGSGCAGAKVRVTLLNRGDDGYKRDEYGDLITVERSISRSGYNGYKLFSARMKEISRSKKDLDAMLDQLNIQVENPVAVLDQEEAKKFLTGKPEDKYNFFCKATELERLDRTYAAVVDNISELEDTKERVRGSMKATMDNVQKLEAEWKESQELEKLEEKLADHNVMYAWSCYHSLVQNSDNQKRILQELENKHTKRSSEVEKAEQAANLTSSEEESLKQKLQELTAEAQSATATKNTLENALRSANEPVRSLERELNTIQREASAVKKRYKTAARHLQEARDKIMTAAGSRQSEEARRVAAISSLEGELVTMKESYTRKKEEIAVLLKDYEDLEPNVDQAKSDTAGITSQHSAVSRRLKDLQSGSGHSIAVFGQKCVEMARRVELAKKKGHFRGPVIGPIGAHIKIAPGKEEFAKIAEHAIGGGTLDRFIVTNDNDRRAYMKLRQEVGCGHRDCGMFQIAEGRRYDVPPPPCQEVETVASVLSISNDLVFNCLVDNCLIDGRALSRSKEESEAALLETDSNGRERMKGSNIKQVFFLPNGDFWQLRGGYRSMTSNDNGNSLRQSIGIDRTAAIESAKREVEILKQELVDSKRREQQLLNQAKSVKLSWNEKGKESRQTAKKIETIQNKLEALKNEQAEAANDFTIDTTEMEEDVAREEEVLEDLKEKQNKKRKEMEQLKPAVEEAKRNLEEVTIRNERVITDITKAEQKLEEFVKGQAHRQATLEKKRAKLELMQTELDQQQKVISSLEEKLQEAMRKARLMTHRTRQQQQNNMRRASIDQPPPSQHPPQSASQADIDMSQIEPIPTPKDSTYYQAKIERARRLIQCERDKRSISERDPEVLLEKFLRAKESLDSKLATIERINKNIEKLINDLKDRKKRWKQFRKHIGDMTDNTFDEILNKKGSSGQIIYDHVKKELNLVVQKDNTNEMSQTKDVKALSGGERSYTTLSLLLALGENLETPFRVMDEFDVFLDPVSRKIALDTMVKVAKEMEHRQFIFITPQDLSGLTPDRMLKIEHLRPPVRSKVAGGPSQSTLDFGSQ